MTTILLTQLAKAFGSTVAVDSIDLRIESGDLFFLLGPSGCGKTTLLRMIAGFIEPTAGSIAFGGREVSNLPPNKRNTGMVFQSYALWPHMTVAENVAYGLTIRKVPADEKAKQVKQALATVQMEEYASRKPTQLSGGQQQRVALARALVVKPTVLLLDEPLSNLDAKLRLEMRTEIRRICTETGITTVYVTHDQKEALSMADQVAVMRKGKVMQIGGPRELYDRPASRFVADFLGESNFIPATVRADDNGLLQLETSVGTLVSKPAADQPRPSGDVLCSIRPEAVRMLADGESGAANVLKGHCRQNIYLGEMAQHVVQIGDSTIMRTLELSPRPFGDPGATVKLTFAAEDVVLLPAEGTTLVRHAESRK